MVAIKSYNKLEIRKKIDEICEYKMEIDSYCKLPNNHIIEIVDSCDTNDNNVLRLNKSDVLMPLYVRTRRVGDRMQLKNTNGSRKLKDIFIDCKIPINQRDKWPVVVDSKDTVVWIPGIKKSKFSKSKVEKCDIILKYI